jgi:glycosyltransferase involved in cell wall biosynthesis
MNIILFSHSTGIVGPIDFLEDYCLKKKYTVFKLQHPLDNYDQQHTLVYRNKRIIIRKKRKDMQFPINLIIDISLTLRFALQRQTDITIGANNLDTLVAIIARSIFHKKINKIIYFASDFSEKRYGNPVLDALYLQIEKWVLRYADVTISNTKRAEKKRRQLGLHIARSIIIPNGVTLPNAKFSGKKIDKHTFIFVGNVTKEHGLIPLLENMLPIINHLVVIGQGEQWEELKGFIKSHHINAELLSVKPHTYIMKYMQQFAGIGLAPYNTKSRWTFFCSPLKVNEYIACGIPVLISNVPEISQTIMQEKLGIVYKSSAPEDLKKGLSQFDTNNYAQKAKKFYETHSYEALYKNIPFIN